MKSETFSINSVRHWLYTGIFTDTEMGRIIVVPLVSFVRNFL